MILYGYRYIFAIMDVHSTALDRIIMNMDVNYMDRNKKYTPNKCPNSAP